MGYPSPRTSPTSDSASCVDRLIGGLITNAVTAGTVRSDVSSEEVAGYCIHALEAARHTPSEEAVSRLRMLVLAGMRPEG